MRKRVLFNRVHEAARFAFGGNQVIPAACREMTTLPRNSGHVGGNRVDAAEVVQQPRVQTVGLERRLDVFDIEPGCCRWGHRVQYSPPC